MSSNDLELTPEERKRKMIAAALMQLEIDEENEVMRMLESSIEEWTKTCGEFERKLQDGEGEDEHDSDWKVKTFHQKDYNAYLEDQIDKLTREVNEQKRRLKNPENPEDDEETDWPKVIMALNRKVTNLKSELKNLAWQLDTESKAYHRADEKRTTLLNTAKHGHHLNNLIEELEAKDKDTDLKVRRGIEKIYKAKRNRLNRELTCPIRNPRRTSAKKDELSKPSKVVVKPMAKTKPLPPIIKGEKSDPRPISPSRIPVRVNPGRKIDLRKLTLLSNATKLATQYEEDG